MRIALSLSETEDINYDRDEVISKRKRRLLAAKNVKHKITTDKNKRLPKKFTSFIPPLPKHSFNLPGKMFKTLIYLKITFFIYCILN